ncbi:hypothetical protein M427DRAFT_135443 [Gonapodya prolifera JEL478]|uniref:Uncharacterized protein n=1 Tax=Gonapodya prolifera (strain JEL478) TaxID=1344416 RepID=A0A139AE07_GONPJ|nr:hypothetical protein M427DRAFT_135443 [Gonapodya prolifera JEL478]|eukprot:KXS14998.1 hypothetical protein M427DRAFT_135443 [Gonapodya prolifera JEL478]
MAQSNGQEDVLSCSVWDAFDRLQMCYAVIPQMRSFYRHGKRKDCSHYRSEFAFCSRVRAMNSEDAQKALQEHERERYIRNSTGRPSVGTIWELRDAPPPNFPPRPDA